MREELAQQTAQMKVQKAELSKYQSEAIEYREKTEKMAKEIRSLQTDLEEEEAAHIQEMGLVKAELTVLRGKVKPRTSR